MAKNLLRNGGFERGDTQFWTPYDYGSFAATTVGEYRGTYCGKLIGAGVDEPYIICTDYISIEEGDAFVFRLAAGAVPYYTMTPQVIFYDEDLVELTTENLVTFALSAAEWRTYVDIITYYKEARYFRIKLKQTTTTIGNYTLFDAASLHKLARLTSIYDEVLLHEKVETEDLTTYYSDTYVAAQAKEAVFELDVTWKYNETGTLDVSIQTYDRHTGNWITIATFNQVTTTLGEQVLVVTAGIGALVRAIGTVGGTDTPGFSWKVSGMFKP